MSREASEIRKKMGMTPSRSKKKVRRVVLGVGIAVIDTHHFYSRIGIQDWSDPFHCKHAVFPKSLNYKKIRLIAEVLE